MLKKIIFIIALLTSPVAAIHFETDVPCEKRFAVVLKIPDCFAEYNLHKEKKGDFDKLYPEVMVVPFGTDDYFIAPYFAELIVFVLENGGDLVFLEKERSTTVSDFMQHTVKAALALYVQNPEEIYQNMFDGGRIMSFPIGYDVSSLERAGTMQFDLDYRPCADFARNCARAVVDAKTDHFRCLFDQSRKHESKFEFEDYVPYVLGFLKDLNFNDDGAVPKGQVVLQDVLKKRLQPTRSFPAVQKLSRELFDEEIHPWWEARLVRLYDDFQNITSVTAYLSSHREELQLAQYNSRQFWCFLTMLSCMPTLQHMKAALQHLPSFLESEATGINQLYRVSKLLKAFATLSDPARLPVIVELYQNHKPQFDSESSKEETFIGWANRVMDHHRGDKIESYLEIIKDYPQFVEAFFSLEEEKLDNFIELLPTLTEHDESLFPDKYGRDRLACTYAV